jgi:signal transduction histidine kinase
VKKIANIIYQSAERLEHLIVNYLMYAELEIALNDPARLQLLRATITNSMRLVIGQAARTAAEKARRPDDLSLDLDDSPGHIAEQHLTKLTLELADNAFKFSAPGTPVELAGRVAGDHYVVTFIDHGRGLLPEQIAHVGAYMQFERKLHEQQGSGLGLTIARRLAEVYGGELTIDSVYGSSTTVQVTLRV